MLIEKGSSILVDTFAMEVYIPSEYATTAYRSTEYYKVVGTTVKFFAVGNMKFFKNEKELENPLSVKDYALGFPMIISSEPSEIDTRDIQFVRGGETRNCIVLRYYKGDQFVTNTACIKSNENVMILLSRLEGGKLDHLSPAEAAQIFADAQDMNGVNLRIPTEIEEVFIAERYRDPEHPSRKARFSENPMYGADYVSYNMRQDAMKTTTFQAITHEDINTSLISSINRKDAGIVDEPLVLERITRGLSLDGEIAERDKRLAAEAAKASKEEG